MIHTANGVVFQTKDWRRSPGAPARAVAIGGNRFENLLVLLPDKADSTRLGEAVFEWLHELGELKRLTSSFAKLVAKHGL